MKESVQVLIRSEGKPLADKDIIGYINEVPVSKAYFNVRYNMFKLSGSETPAEDAWESLKLNAAEAEFAKEKNIYPTEKEIREEAAQQPETMQLIRAHITVKIMQIVKISKTALILRFETFALMK